MQLSWLPQFEFAAFYVAKAKGWYQKEGLEVHIISGGPTLLKSSTQRVADGEVEAGVAYSGALVDALKEGRIRIMGALFEHTPLQLLVKGGESGTLDDLGHYRIYMNEKERRRTALSLLLSQSGIDFVFKPFDIEAYRNDPKGAIALFGSNHFFYDEIRRRDQKILRIDPAAYGYDFYDDFLIVNDLFWQKKPLEARRFIWVTIKAWRYALEHIEETIDLLKKEGLGLSKIALRFEATRLKNYLSNTPHMRGLVRRKKLQLMVERFFSDSDEKVRLTLDDVVDPLFLYHQDLITAKERDWMAHHLLTYSETWWPPFTIPKSDGSIEGIIPDLLKQIYQNTGLLMRYTPYRHWDDVLQDVLHGKLDMAAATGRLKKRGEKALFCMPYAFYPYGMATRSDTKHIIFEPLNAQGRRIAVGRSYTAEEMLRKEYPALTIVPVKDTKEGLEKLMNKEVDGVVDILPALKYLVAYEHYPQFRITTPFKEHFMLSAMMRKGLERARDIFNKGLTKVSEAQYQAIANRWQPVTVQKRDSLFLKPFFGALVVIAALALLLYKLKREVNQRKKIERELDRTLKILDRYILLSKSDLKGNITYVSQAFEKLTGYTKEELIGQNHRILRDPTTSKKVYQELWEKIGKGEVWHTPLLKNRTKKGDTYWVEETIVPITNEEGEVIEYLAVRKDLTPYKKLEELAMRDVLSGFYNRRAFNEMAPMLLSTAQRKKSPVLFGIFDVDNFKAYNTLYGHMAGDEALRRVTDAVRRALGRKSDLLFRLGGEEFGVLIFDVQDGYRAEAIGQMIVESVGQAAIEHEGNPPYGVVTISLGLVYCQRIEESDGALRALYRLADEKMYEAKERGKNRFVLCKMDKISKEGERSECMDS